MSIPKSQSLARPLRRENAVLASFPPLHNRNAARLADTGKGEPQKEETPVSETKTDSAPNGGKEIKPEQSAQTQSELLDIS